MSHTQIRRAKPADFADFWELLLEYFEAAQVVVRDSRESILGYLQDEASGIWLAYSDGEAAGCIALRSLPGAAGEVKRLYVRSRFRRMGIAAQLLSALESGAASMGMRKLYMDTTDSMQQAIRLYEAAGYQRRERYNDNPQATLFYEKPLELPIVVRAFRTGDEAAFRSLNEAWITQLFALEAKDLETLGDPETHILDKGGKIYMACRGAETVGCCAFLKLADGSYELAKMGVAGHERGRGVGRKLLESAIAAAREWGARRLYLETNHKLANAIHLYESAGFRHLKPAEVSPSPYARADVYMEMVWE